MFFFLHFKPNCFSPCQRIRRMRTRIQRMRRTWRTRRIWRIQQIQRIWRIQRTRRIWRIQRIQRIRRISYFSVSFTLLLKVLYLLVSYPRSYTWLKREPQISIREERFIRRCLQYRVLGDCVLSF